MQTRVKVTYRFTAAAKEHNFLECDIQKYQASDLCAKYRPFYTK